MVGNEVLELKPGLSCSCAALDNADAPPIKIEARPDRGRRAAATGKQETQLKFAMLERASAQRRGSKGPWVNRTQDATQRY